MDRNFVVIARIMNDPSRLGGWQTMLGFFMHGFLVC